MEEKKLTDEVVIKALLVASEGFSKLYNGNLYKDAFDLIKRLQNCIKEYETLFDISNERKYRKMFNEEWKKEYQKELDKQGEGVIAGFPDFDLVYKLYFDQKAEIERLAKVNMQTIGKNAELLLKVDELKERCEIAEGTKNRLTIFDRMSIHDKAVKGTAKEIFILAEDYNCGYETDMDNFMKELKERYGVEVE